MGFFVFCFFPLVEKNSNLKKILKNFKKKKNQTSVFIRWNSVFILKVGWPERATCSGNLLLALYKAWFSSIGWILMFLSQVFYWHGSYNDREPQERIREGGVWWMYSELLVWGPWLSHITNEKACMNCEVMACEE